MAEKGKVDEYVAIDIILDGSHAIRFLRITMKMFDETIESLSLSKQNTAPAKFDLVHEIPCW